MYSSNRSAYPYNYNPYGRYDRYDPYNSTFNRNYYGPGFYDGYPRTGYYPADRYYSPYRPAYGN
jgi:hypothetical protein